MCCIAGGPSALLAGDDSKLALGEGTPGLMRDLGLCPALNPMTIVVVEVAQIDTVVISETMVWYC